MANDRERNLSGNVADPGSFSRLLSQSLIEKTLGGSNGSDVSKLLAAITADRRVYAAAPRVYGYGLLSAAHRSAGVVRWGLFLMRNRK